jgi:iron complex outermembrane receptor protein
VFQYSQADAEFMGFEASLHIALYDQGSDQLHLQLMVDAVAAELSDSGENLPFIPPLRAGARLHYRGAHWHAYAGAMRVDEQDDVASYEQPTDGYTLVEASVGYRFKPVGGTVHEVLLRGTNLSDELARNHVSRLRDFAPLPGRDISLAYRLIF